MAWVFNKTLWVQDNPPYVTAAQLNRMEAGIDAAGKLADTKIADGVLIAGTTLTFANIPQTFTHLRLYVVGQSQRPGFTNTGLRFRFNNDASASYNFTYWSGYNNAAAITGTFVAGQSSGYIAQVPALGRGDDNAVALVTVDIPYYTGPHYKFAMSSFQFNDGAVQSGGGMARNNYYGAIAPVTTITVVDDAGTALGPRAKASLYGVM